MRATRFAVAAFSVFFTTAVAAAQNTPSGAAITDNPAFQNHCARCHGKTAKGHRFGPPSLVSGKAPQRAAEELRAVITSGKGRMPNFGDTLSTDEIETLIQQIKSAPAQ